MKKRTIAFFLLAAAAANPRAGAHYLWLETKDAGTTVPFELYYGEYEEGKREESGGRLDEVTLLEVWTENEHPPTLAKKENHFSGTVELPEKPYFLQAQELNRPVKDWTKYNIGIVKPMFYTSMIAGKGPIPPVPERRTRLAVYPLLLGEHARVQVFFEGEPLAGAKVQVHAPNLWSKEISTDEEGIAEIALPWSERYVFEVIHLEKIPGEFEGAAYEALRHRATFSFERP